MLKRRFFELLHEKGYLEVVPVEFSGFSTNAGAPRFTTQVLDQSGGQ
jgi:hypothetical protein